MNEAQSSDKDDSKHNKNGKETEIDIDGTHIKFTLQDKSKATEQLKVLVNNKIKEAAFEEQRYHVGNVDEHNDCDNCKIKYICQGYHGLDPDINPDIVGSIELTASEHGDTFIAVDKEAAKELENLGLSLSKCDLYTDKNTGAKMVANILTADDVTDMVRKVAYVVIQQLNNGRK